MLIVMALYACNNEPNKGQSAEPVIAAPSANVNNLAAGRQIFEDKCIVCHGSDGTAGIAGAANLKILPGDSATITETVTSGRNAMPAFGSTLSANEINLVMRYVKSLHQ